MIDNGNKKRSETVWSECKSIDRWAKTNAKKHTLRVARRQALKLHLCGTITVGYP